MVPWRRAEFTGWGPIPLHNRKSYTEALKVRHFHRVRRPSVPEEVGDISTKIVLLTHPILDLLTIRNSMARRNRITVHSRLVLLPALSVLPTSHTYQLLISQLAASTSPIMEVNLTRHPRPTRPINLLHLRPDHTSSGMAIAFLPRSDQIQDRNTRVLPQSYRFGNSHYLRYQPPNLQLRDRSIHHLLLHLHHFHQV